ncbi:phasin [Zhengella mangrovi]|uniref:Phasin n=1 Tax=Zhengella mangrovi TaxID=1982044 RepID=A0A2G1QM11_9HYPH|nr:phasin [Zhengella mangrovi]PHP66258.1 phasin [Zhengella mangrovi]
MTKATKTAETIEFPAFDAAKATDQMRSFAEKGVEQTQEAYAKMKANAEEAQKMVEDSVETVRGAVKDVSMKTIAAMRANAEAGFAHMEALMGVKSLSDFVELQSAYVRKQTEMATEQAKDMQSVTTKAVEDVSKPAKTAFEKAVKEFKVA